jgi:hypothetical protein
MWENRRAYSDDTIKDFRHAPPGCPTARLGYAIRGGVVSCEAPMTISLDSTATFSWLPVLLGVPYRCEYEVVQRDLAQEALHPDRRN